MQKAEHIALGAGTLETFLAILLGGSLATLFWITIMFAFVGKEFHHGDMISMIGSGITSKAYFYFSRGILLYIITGLLLAPIYYLILSFLSFDDVISNMAVSMFIGISQGFLLMLFFVEEPTLHHPERHLQNFRIPVAVAYWVGNLAYAVALAAILSSYMLHSWKGFLISSGAVLGFSLIISFFVKRGATREGLEHRYGKEQV